MTQRQLSLHPTAVDEAEAPARWYRERSLRAAERFVAEITDVIKKILASPQRWPKATHGTRKAKLPCFPFLVIYRESKESNHILAIAHGRRRPGYWTTRR